MQHCPESFRLSTSRRSTENLHEFEKRPPWLRHVEKVQAVTMTWYCTIPSLVNCHSHCDTISTYTLNGSYIERTQFESSLKALDCRRANQTCLQLQSYNPRPSRYFLTVSWNTMLHDSMAARSHGRHTLEHPSENLLSHWVVRHHDSDARSENLTFFCLVVNRRQSREGSPLVCSVHLNDYCTYR